MNIIEIYDKYHLPENLQMHMLRVAACANLILDNWNGKEFDKDAVMRVSLLHDMGNILKIPEDFSDDEGFKELRRKYFEIYGTNEHELNMEIGRIEGLSEKELTILEGKRSRYNEQTLKSDVYEVKICAYCDQRVAPDGVCSIRERLEDAKERYKDRPFSVWSDEKKANRLIECSLAIEKQIMDCCDIGPEDINDESIAGYIENLREYEI